MRLRSENLVKRYGSRTVVREVSVDVEQGEIVGLLGPNGAGKTTTFYMVVGFVKPTAGRVYLDGDDITELAMFRRAQRGVGYLPQEPSVFRKLTVSQNIRAVLEMTDLSRAEQRARHDDLIEEFSLQKVAGSLGDTLSGGERRRTEIARALATGPKFILLDEPFAGIDPIAKEDIQSIVAQLKNRNIGILITDHDAPAMLRIVDRSYLMFEGKILRHGTPAELAADELAREVYLGQNIAV